MQDGAANVGESIVAEAREAEFRTETSELTSEFGT